MAPVKDLLFKWEESAVNRHHCDECGRPLSHPKALLRCIGKHCEVCFRYHQLLHRIRRSHHCKACLKTDWMHRQRHVEIAHLLDVIYQAANSSFVQVHRLDDDAPEPTQDHEDPPHASLEESTPTKSRRVRKTEKKLAKAIAVSNKRHTLTESHFEMISEILHPPDKPGGDGNGVGDGDGPETENEIEEIMGNLQFHAQLWLSGGLKLAARDGSSAQQEFDFSLEMERILGTLRVDEYLEQSDVTGKGKRELLGTVAKLKKAILDDLLQVRQEDAQTRFRRGAFLRYIGREAYDRLLLNNKINDWRTGAKIQYPEEVEEEEETDDEILSDDEDNESHDSSDADSDSELDLDDSLCYFLDDEVQAKNATADELRQENQVQEEIPTASKNVFIFRSPPQAQTVSSTPAELTTSVELALSANLSSASALDDNRPRDPSPEPIITRKSKQKKQSKSRSKVKFNAGKAQGRDGTLISETEYNPSAPERSLTLHSSKANAEPGNIASSPFVSTAPSETLDNHCIAADSFPDEGKIRVIDRLDPAETVTAQYKPNAPLRDSDWQSFTKYVQDTPSTPGSKDDRSEATICTCKGPVDTPMEDMVYLVNAMESLLVGPITRVHALRLIREGIYNGKPVQNLLLLDGCLKPHCIDGTEQPASLLEEERARTILGQEGPLMRQCNAVQLQCGSKKPSEIQWVCMDTLDDIHTKDHFERVCYCEGIRKGEMVECIHGRCMYGGFFHLQCISMNSPPTESWYCWECCMIMHQDVISLLRDIWTDKFRKMDAQIDENIFPKGVLMILKKFDTQRRAFQRTLDRSKELEQRLRELDREGTDKVESPETSQDVCSEETSKQPLSPSSFEQKDSLSSSGLLIPGECDKSYNESNSTNTNSSRTVYLDGRTVAALNPSLKRLQVASIIRATRNVLGWNSTFKDPGTQRDKITAVVEFKASFWDPYRVAAFAQLRDGYDFEKALPELELTHPGIVKVTFQVLEDKDAKMLFPPGDPESGPASLQEYSAKYLEYFETRLNRTGYYNIPRPGPDRPFKTKKQIHFCLEYWSCCDVVAIEGDTALRNFMKNYKLLIKPTSGKPSSWLTFWIKGYGATKLPKAAKQTSNSQKIPDLKESNNEVRLLPAVPSVKETDETRDGASVLENTVKKGEDDKVHKTSEENQAEKGKKPTEEDKDLTNQPFDDETADQPEADLLTNIEEPSKLKKKAKRKPKKKKKKGPELIDRIQMVGPPVKVDPDDQGTIIKYFQHILPPETGLETTEQKTEEFLSQFNHHADVFIDEMIEKCFAASKTGEEQDEIAFGTVYSFSWKLKVPKTTMVRELRKMRKEVGTVRTHFEYLMIVSLIRSYQAQATKEQRLTHACHVATEATWALAQEAKTDDTDIVRMQLKYLADCDTVEATNFLRRLDGKIFPFELLRHILRKEATFTAMCEPSDLIEKFDDPSWLRIAILTAIVDASGKASRTAALPSPALIAAPQDDALGTSGEVSTKAEQTSPAPDTASQSSFSREVLQKALPESPITTSDEDRLHAISDERARINTGLISTASETSLHIEALGTCGKATTEEESTSPAPKTAPGISSLRQVLQKASSNSPTTPTNEDLLKAIETMIATFKENRICVEMFLPPCCNTGEEAGEMWLEVISDIYLPQKILNRCLSADSILSGPSSILAPSEISEQAIRIEIVMALSDAAAKKSKKKMGAKAVVATDERHGSESAGIASSDVPPAGSILPACPLFAPDPHSEITEMIDYIVEHAYPIDFPQLDGPLSPTYQLFITVLQTLRRVVSLPDLVLAALGTEYFTRRGTREELYNVLISFAKRMYVSYDIFVANLMLACQPDTDRLGGGERKIALADVSGAWVAERIEVPSVREVEEGYGGYSNWIAELKWSRVGFPEVDEVMVRTPRQRAAEAGRR